MHLRDLPFGKRLMALAAVVLTFLPILVLVGTGIGIFHWLSWMTGGWEVQVVQIWPRVAPIAVHFATARMRDVAERESWEPHEMEEQCRLLEGSGMAVLVEKDGMPVYLSPGARAETVVAEAEKKTGRGHAALVWDDAGFAYTYHSTRAIDIYTVGQVSIEPMALTASQRETRQRGRVMIYVLFGVGLLVALLFALFFIRTLTREVLRPLAAMRRSAVAIEHGDFDVSALPPGNVVKNDEIGVTCRSFDAMRRGLQAARAERERYEANRKELLSGIAHDLATPLTSIKGYASGILDGVARTEEKRMHYAAQIVQSADIMEHLVQNLFLFSKLDLGRITFELTNVDLSAYLSDFVADRAAWYEEQGLGVELHLLEGAPSMVVALDAQEFQRVIENILSNARKYGGEQPRVDISLVARDGVAELRFADHGPGVAAEELGKLFESFYRTDKARSQTAKGSGLGLAIARRILEGMGGTIHAEETPGGGLTIVLQLPLVPKTETYQKPSAPQEKEKEPS
ncbi:MAG: HAMP domain-containing sensor histidine kinase [Selenomonadaceae bacterium]|nr:HAMP domain-containing sensor histidine kinase [Selenomonadaceae bacterium]